MVAFPDTFSTNLARTCRGLIIGQNGVVKRRPFDKFFNVNEKEETQSVILDEKTIDFIAEKVDGSMIAPWLDEFSDLNFDTKKLNMEMREKINRVAPDNIKEFTLGMLKSGQQPIFELYHPDIPETNIVIEYNKPIWRLLAIRDMETGGFMLNIYVDELSKKSNIVRPTRSRELESLKTSEIVEHVKTCTGIEGVVIYYNDGTIAKVKSNWYLERHNILDVFKFPHKMASMVLNEESIDDASAFMTPERLLKYKKFATELHQYMAKIVEQVIKTAESYDTKKEYGLSGKNNEIFSSVVFQLIGSTVDESEVFTMIRKVVLSYTTKTTQFEKLQSSEQWGTL